MSLSMECGVAGLYCRRFIAMWLQRGGDDDHVLTDAREASPLSLLCCVVVFVEWFRSVVLWSSKTSFFFSVSNLSLDGGGSSAVSLKFVYRGKEVEVRFRRYACRPMCRPRRGGAAALLRFSVGADDSSKRSSTRILPAPTMRRAASSGAPGRNRTVQQHLCHQIRR